MALGQATALETYDRKIATNATQNNYQLPEIDSTTVCTFICLKIAKIFLELQPVSDEGIVGTFILTTLSTFRWTYGKRSSLNLPDDFSMAWKALIL